MNIENLRSIVENEECGHIEYKMQWYWDATSKDIHSGRNWGEFIKDILALANANLQSFEKDRYLVYGYNEVDEKFYDAKIPTDKKLLEKFIDSIKSKINAFITPVMSIVEYLNFLIDGKNIFVIKISQHPFLFSLSNDIQTDSIPYRKGTTLYREEGTGGKLDSVGVMSQSIITRYNALIDNFYNSSIRASKVIATKSIERTVSNYIRSSRNLIHADGYPKKGNTNGYYEIYKLQNKVQGTFEYFIFIDESASMKSLIETIKSNENFETQPFLLTNRPLNLKNPESRILNLKKVSKWDKVCFIEDFGKEYLYHEQIKDFLFEELSTSAPTFIRSQAQFKKSTDDALDKMSEWYDTEDLPLLIITGEGGIGKTEIVRRFLNEKLKVGENFLLYVDSGDIIDSIESKVTDIYHIYKSIVDEEHEIFHDELFKLCIDNGTLTIVIDGLDEVIARLNTKFNLNDFIQSVINNYSFNLTRAKIIITCRDSIWDNFTGRDSNKITEMKLLPFSNEQVKTYFEKSFDSKKTSGKAIGFANNLKFDIKGENHFSPFVVDTIRRLLTEDPDGLSEDKFKVEESLKDQFYFSNTPTDFLIIAVLRREVVKNPRLNINNQIQVFTKISDTPSGTILKEELFRIIKSEIIKDFDKSDFESFLTHQFLNIHGNEISFRYDFFKEFFSILQIVLYINNQSEKLNNCLINKFYSNLGYQNSFTKQIAKKINIGKNELDVMFADLLNLNYLRKNFLETGKISESEIDHKLSLSLSLYLTILAQMNMLNNTEDFNNVLLEFFEKENVISGLCLTNINTHNIKPKILFDFRGKKLVDCSFKFYSNFLECSFNEHTFFDKGCSIYISEDTSSFKSLQLTRKNFDLEADINSHLLNLLGKIEHENSSKISDNEKQLRDFLKLFKKNGDFKPQKQEFIKSRKGYMVRSMLSLGVIINNDKAKINSSEFMISPMYHSDLYDYLHQASPSIFVTNVLNKM